MKIFSFCEHHRDWVPVEIEVSFIPGLPQIHLLGMPDSALKESLIKIKSALRFQGFELPKSKQIIVNIRGGDFKKKSQGLDLAIAVAIINGIEEVFKKKELVLYVYGELSLTGEVFPFEDVLTDEKWKVTNLLSGDCESLSVSENHFKIKELKEILQIKFSKAGIKNIELKSPSEKEEEFFKQQGVLLKCYEESTSENLKFSEKEARLLQIASLGRHSLLLMGPRGLGKTTLAESLNHLSEKPEVKHYIHQKKYFPLKDNHFWRPFVRPHHSITHLALIGGGASCSPGEITRAHGGILLLDEMLEFSPQCQEALREPLQSKEVHLVRGQRFQTYPCDFQLVGTTNLCPCGQWLPGAYIDCHRPAKKCSQYREKLSGPLLDRFSMLYFLKKSDKDEKKISLSEVLKRVSLARSFQKSLVEGVCFEKEKLSMGLKMRLSDELGSLRRLNASIEVSKTIALLEGVESVGDAEMEEALNYTWNPFLDLKI